MIKKVIFLFSFFFLLCINVSFAFEETWDFSVTTDYYLSNSNEIGFSGNSVVLKKILTPSHT